MAAWVLGALVVTGQAADKGKAISLFNGRDLSNWTPKKDGAWEVRDGLLQPSAKPGGYIWADGSYENFELKLEFKILVLD